MNFKLILIDKKIKTFLFLIVLSHFPFYGMEVDNASENKVPVCCFDAVQLPKYGVVPISKELFNKNENKFKYLLFCKVNLNNKFNENKGHENLPTFIMEDNEKNTALAQLIVSKLNVESCYQNKDILQLLINNKKNKNMFRGFNWCVVQTKDKNRLVKLFCLFKRCSNDLPKEIIKRILWYSGNFDRIKHKNKGGEAFYTYLPGVKYFLIMKRGVYGNYLSQKQYKYSEVSLKMINKALWLRFFYHNIGFPNEPKKNNLIYYGKKFLDKEWWINNAHVIFDTTKNTHVYSIARMGKQIKNRYKNPYYTEKIKDKEGELIYLTFKFCASDNGTNPFAYKVYATREKQVWKFKSPQEKEDNLLFKVSFYKNTYEYRVNIFSSVANMVQSSKYLKNINYVYKLLQDKFGLSLDIDSLSYDDLKYLYINTLAVIKDMGLNDPNKFMYKYFNVENEDLSSDLLEDRKFYLDNIIKNYKNKRGGFYGRGAQWVYYEQWFKDVMRSFARSYRKLDRMGLFYH